MMTLRDVSALAIALTLAGVTIAAAQPPAEPPPPPPGWTGSIGAGMALTSGNTDTKNINVGYDVLRDYGTNVLFKSTGVYLKGENDGVSTVDRLGADARIDRKLSPRLSVFGMTTYARDSFKNIDYLVAPTAGLSYKVIATERTEWATDGSVGIVSEKDTGFDLETSGAIIAGEQFVHKFNDNSRFYHTGSGLWKMSDFDDAFYNFSVGVATAVAGNFDLKVEFLESYKNRPSSPLLKKSDQSVILAVVYKY